MTQYPGRGDNRSPGFLHNRGVPKTDSKYPPHDRAAERLDECPACHQERDAAADERFHDQLNQFIDDKRARD